jgi:hypothetical protein
MGDPIHSPVSISVALCDAPMCEEETPKNAWGLAELHEESD